jgi:hypothetical protein
MKIYRLSVLFTPSYLLLFCLTISILQPIALFRNIPPPESPQSSIVPINPSITNPTVLTTPNETILPHTNLSVSLYWDIELKETFNTTVLSLNTTHWFTRNNYNITNIGSPFDSVVSRDSVNHSYYAMNYWDWQGNPSVIFDFWIDTKGFYEGYQYESQGTTISVDANETIDVPGYKIIPAWKITIDVGLIISAWYAIDSGLFLSLHYFVVQNIWYNLTKAEIATLPLNYQGPIITNPSPSNGSTLASGTIISVELTSPFGIDIIYYNWDDILNSTTQTSIETSLPSTDGPHLLLIFAYDMVGYYNLYYLEYTTDDALPGIILNDVTNNSRVRGDVLINLTIVSGNGTVFYNWDNESTTQSIIEDQGISFPDLLTETTHILNVSVKSVPGVWTSTNYVFTVDNTPPSLEIFNFVNNSVTKEEFSVIISVSETSSITSLLNNGSRGNLVLEVGVNHTIKFTDLDNGTYILYLEAVDEAKNRNITNLAFSIYLSDFAWNWPIISDQPQSIDFTDENGTFWFTCTLVSHSTQSYNLSLLARTNPKIQNSSFLFGLRFECEELTDIIYISFSYPLDEVIEDFNQTFRVFQWVKWNKQNQEWEEVDTVYNQVLHSWETTIIGSNSFFALIETDTQTKIKSVELGGGQIPSFEFPMVILALSTYYGIYIKRKQKKGE